MAQSDNNLPNTPLPSQNQAQKLTDWPNEPTPQILKSDFEQAKPAHDTQMGKINKWNDLAGVKGTAAIKKVKGRSSVQPKLIRRQAEWRYSALTEPFLGTDKLYMVSPVTFEDQDAADQNELVLNWQFRTKLNRIKFIDDYVRAVVDEGTGIVQVGWCRTTVPMKQEVPIYTHYQLTDPQGLQQLQQAIELSTANPRQYNENVPPEIQEAVNYYNESGQATTAVKTGSTTQMIDKVMENRPTADILNPENFFLDPSCNGDPEKALFAVVSFETYKAELEKNPKRYPAAQLAKVNWEGNTPLSQPDHATNTPDSFQITDKLRKKVVAYEYWGVYDIMGDGKLVPIVATWIGDVIIRMELNPFPDQKIPFVLVPYLPVKREAYGEPDAELLEDNQKILGAVTRGMIDLMGRSANSQQGFAKGMLDPLNRRRLENGQDYEFNPNVSPNQGLIEHKYPELPQSAMLMLNLQNQEAEALTGVKSFSGGVSGEAYGDVAAGIRGALDAASKREMAILRRLSKGMSDIGTKIIAMNSVFLSEKEVVRVTNTTFVTVNREDLAGNFDLEVDISTAEVDNQKSQDLAFMLQTIGPKADPQIMMLILAKIAKLKRMPDLEQQLKTYQPQPDPIAQAMQQAELAAAQKKVQVMQSEIDLNEAQAKAAGATADKKNLDYVEQETGTTHARDMQKQQAQSEGNQNLAVTKALLTPQKHANGTESKPNVAAAVGFNSVSQHLSNAGQPTPAPVNIPQGNLAGQAPQFPVGGVLPQLNPAAAQPQQTTPNF